MRRYRGLIRPSGAFSRHQFSVDYTITMFGFDFRQGQPPSNPAVLEQIEAVLHAYGVIVFASPIIGMLKSRFRKRQPIFTSV
jgi:hypothetical protein